MVRANSRRKSKGYILVVTAVSSIALLAFIGLSIDTGYLSWVRRRAQTAADAAAMSAMLELKSGNNLTNATTVALADATTNGFTNGVANTTVSINNPPLYGSFAGNNSYVEAIVRQTVPNAFMVILGENNTQIGAHSTARMGSGGSGGGGCIYALNKTASRALSLAGSNTLSSACSAYSESTSSTAYYSEGSITLSLSHTAKVGIATGGTYQINNGTKIIDVSTGATELPVNVTDPGDPLASVAAPVGGSVVKAAATYYDSNAQPPGKTIGPGVYCGGLKFGNTGGNTFKMTAGPYVMAGGGFVLGSQAVVDATAGVTIYTTSSSGYACSQAYSFSPINIDGQSVFKINAPTSGSLAGIAVFQDRNITSSLQNQIVSQSTTVINGALYFAHSPLLWSGTNVNTGYMILVADTIAINGNSLFVDNDYSTLSAGSPIGGTTSYSGLVE